MLKTRTMTTILGTTAMLCSWICVSAWNKPISSPTTRPATSTGAPMSKHRPERSAAEFNCLLRVHGDQGSGVRGQRSGVRDWGLEGLVKLEPSS